MSYKLYLPLLLCTLFICCKNSDGNSNHTSHNLPVADQPLPYDSTIRTVHVFVALCDNRYQGIVPVPAAIGNGQDPARNLYWGCSLGIYSYFKNSREWTFIKKVKLDSIRLERIIFKHKTQNCYFIADAYDGRNIKECTVDFLKSCSGIAKDTIHVDNKVLGIAGNSQLVSYIGHNGLMDFKLGETFINCDNKQRDAIILACISKKYFTPLLKEAGAYPLLWTTQLMCPEAYTLHDALSSYLTGKSNPEIRTSAARAYAKYQHCSENAAKGLLVTGW